MPNFFKQPYVSLPYAAFYKSFIISTAELVFQKSFYGAAGKKERFGKNGNKEVLSGYGIAALYGVSKGRYIKRAAATIAGKAAALTCYSRLCLA